MVVSVVVIVAVRVEAEAETSPEVAIMKSTAVEFTTTESTSVETAAIMETEPCRHHGIRRPPRRLLHRRRRHHHEPTLSLATPGQWTQLPIRRSLSYAT